PGESRERWRHRGQVIEVREATGVAVDHGIGDEPAEPQVHREVRPEQRPADSPTSRAGREPRDGEREQPTYLTGQLTVGEPQGSRRRAYEESRQAAAGSRLERTTRVARRLHRGAQGWLSHRGGLGA